MIRPRLVFRVFFTRAEGASVSWNCRSGRPSLFHKGPLRPGRGVPGIRAPPKNSWFVSAIVEPNGHLANYRHGARRDRSGSWKSNHSKREEIMSTFYKKATLICAAAAAGTMLCAMPISVERSAISGIVLSIDQAQARVGHPGSAVSVAGVNRRHRRADRRCATGVTC